MICLAARVAAAVSAAAVYFTPLIGAFLADLWLGKYRTILALSLVYCAGHVVLAVDNTRTGLMLGLGLIALGFKQAEAQKAVTELLRQPGFDPASSADRLIREALRRLQ